LLVFDGQDKDLRPIIGAEKNAFPGFPGGVFVGGSVSSRDIAALHVDPGLIPTGSSIPLDNGDLPFVTREAIRQWEQTGLVAPGSLANVNVQMADLGGDLLGIAFGDLIVLDIDAAGFGWFVDRTPADDIEFQVASPLTQGRVDLLTVISHELGHILGLSHHEDESHLMSDQLAPGTRHRIEDDEMTALDSLFGKHALDNLLL
jgi:hypothetical protein